MGEFFEKEVKGGYEKLVGVTSIFEQYLSNGYAIEVVLEGHASPLANPEYNTNLSNRRVNSVINFISSYGSLRKYLKNKQLSVSLVPLGESDAPSTVSDDSKNPQRAIYSLEASRERRVIVKDIIIKKN
ncbi:MAG: hypothetical protein HC817_04780 [Saprospiraceae bacterium]|nr:hypothetical protein [Saprospiraceae bacterium]